MCEWCGKVDASETTALGPEEAEEMLCEDESQYEPGHMCGAPAAYRSKDRFVEMHLCEKHMETRKAELSEGLGDLLKSAALAEGIMAKPIQAKENCDEFEFVGAEECGQPASYAYIVTQESYACEQHKVSK
jgi:hypothetical protein